MRFLVSMALASLVLVSCTSLPGNHVELIEAPEVVALAKREFGYEPKDKIEVAYATDRERGADGSYSDERGQKIWLGFASLNLDRRRKGGRIDLDEVRESGVLHASESGWDLPASSGDVAGEADSSII